MTPAPTSRFAGTAVSALVCLLLLFACSRLHATPTDFNIAAQPAADAVRAFIKQSGRQVLFNASELKGTQANEVKGAFEPAKALDLLLAGTGQVAQASGDSGFTITRADSTSSDPNAARAAQPSDRPMRNEKGDEAPTKLEPVKVLGKFEVMESRLLNMDLPRSRDDVQPYVIFNAEEIQHSGALALDDFLKTRLPMNATAISASQDPSLRTAPARSSFNLRGLGLSQTLILVDGRRLPLSFGALYLQSDTNGIPVSAVERIEVLPTTSSGIYGGSATGGVINIILRRNYSGAEVKFSYDNSFRTDSANKRVDVAAGFSLEGGKTNVILSASRATSNALFAQDRDFNERLVQHILAVSGGNMTALDLYQLLPPVGSTTNIKSATGVPLTLKNGTPLNATITYVPAGYLGGSSDGGVALVGNAGKYNLGRSNAGAYFRGASYSPLLAPPDRDSFMAMVRRQFTANLQGFLEVGAGNVKSPVYGTSASGSYTLSATSPVNPFNQSISIMVPFNRSHDGGAAWDQSRRVAGGFIAKLPGEWLGEIDYTWGSFSHRYVATPRPLSTFSPQVNAGTYDPLRDDFKFFDLSTVSYPSYFYTKQPYRNESNDAALRLSGPIATMPAGPLTVATMLDYHEDLAPSTYYNFLGADNFVPRRSQVVSSAYAEFRVPLVGQTHRYPFVRELELQLAGRADRYHMRGAPSSVAATATSYPTATNGATSVNPTAGVRLKVTDSVMLRASYSEGFLPPDFTQLTQTASPVTNGVGLRDPRRGNEPIVNYTQYTGGNSDLRPEKSKSASVGIVLTPSGISGLRLSLDWVRIKKVDNLTTLGSQDVINNERFLAGRVIRGANLPGDPSGWPGPVTALNLGYSNISMAEMEAYDLRADYVRPLGTAGKLSFYAATSWEPHLKTQLVPSAPVIENVGTGVGFGTSRPLHFRGNAGATWTSGPLTLGWDMQYYGAFIVSAFGVDSTALRQVQGNGGRVAPQAFHDVSVTYRMDHFAASKWAWFGRTELTVGVKNVFNTKPSPVIDANESTTYNPYGDPRLAVYFVSLKKTF